MGTWRGLAEDGAGEPVPSNQSCGPHSWRGHSPHPGAQSPLRKTIRLAQLRGDVTSGGLREASSGKPPLLSGAAALPALPCSLCLCWPCPHTLSSRGCRYTPTRAVSHLMACTARCRGSCLQVRDLGHLCRRGAHCHIDAMSLPPPDISPHGSPAPQVSRAPRNLLQTPS